MEHTVTFTELKQNLRAVKEAARQDVVHVLTSGQPGYILCSFEVWEKRMEDAGRRGAYRVNVEESIIESEQDVREGRMALLREAVTLDHDAQDHAYVTASALRVLDVEYDGDHKLLLGQTLSELIRRPDIGETVDVEYRGAAKGTSVRKFYSPPCDVLYLANEERGLIVYGFVRSLQVVQGG